MKQAHVHLISVLWSDLREAGVWKTPRPLRLLDVGCGYGGLIKDVMRWETVCCPLATRIEVYGFEVEEHRGASLGYQTEVVADLERACPGVDWAERVRVGAAGEAWPFPDGFFDYAVSNQVIEHVADLPFFFQQLRRLLRPGGRAGHFFPSREILVEPHSGVPLAHWFGDGPGRERWILGCSRFGIGKYSRYRQRGYELEGFAEEFCSYLRDYVHFRSSRAVGEEAGRHCALAGYGFDIELLGRAWRDDWELYPYTAKRVGSTTGALRRFAPVTLLQRF